MDQAVVSTWSWIGEDPWLTQDPWSGKGKGKAKDLKGEAIDIEQLAVLSLRPSGILVEVLDQRLNRSRRSQAGAL